MPHTITGEIRKEPFTKEGQSGKLYIVELSERYKDRDNNAQYTNYKFFFNAKTDNIRQWYDEAFQVGKVVSIQCDQLRVEVNDHNGKSYTTLVAAGFPTLAFSQRGGGQQQSGGQQQGWGQPHQPQGNQQQRQQAPQNFDDDIPF